MSNKKNHIETLAPKLLKLLKYGVYLAAFIPLIIFSQYMSPFHFGKAIVFRSLIEILAVFYVVLLVKYGKRYLPPKTPLFWLITLFTVIFGLATFASINFYQSFWGTLERMGGWFSFLHFWGFFVIASAVLRKKEDWFTFIKLSLAVSLVSAFYGFLQKTDISWVIGSGGRAKIFGTIGNPALFAGYIIVNAFLALMLSFRPGNTRNEKRFYAAVFLIGTLAVLLTGVRGSVLAVVIGVILFGLFYSFNFTSRKIKLATLIFLVVIIAIAGILYSLRNTDFVKNNLYLARYADISPKAYTVQTRLWAWQAGFDGWNDSFKTIVLGWGPEMFNIPFSKHFNPKFFRGPSAETLFDRAHNQFLEVLFTMGLIGFVAYILIFVFAFKDLSILNSNPEEKVFRVGLASTLIAYIIHNSFIFDTTTNYIMFFLILGFINLLRESGNPVIASPQLSNGKSLLTYIVGIILVIAAVFSIYQFEIIPAKANYATTRAIVASWEGNQDLAFEKFKEAMSYNTFGKYEIRHRYAQYIIEQATTNGVNQKMKEWILSAIENVKKNAEEFPQDYLPYLYISRSYIMLGKDDPKSPYNDLALENAMKALEISPTFVRTYFEVAQVYLNKKELPEAAEWFEKAAELSPEAKISFWYLGMTYVQMGQVKKGIEIIEKSGYNYQNEFDLRRLIDAYLELKDFKNIARLYEILIRIKPNSAQYHASLAATYSRIGEIDKAVQQAKIAAQLDPSFAKEAEAFIKSLGR